MRQDIQPAGMRAWSASLALVIDFFTLRPVILPIYVQSSLFGSIVRLSREVFLKKSKNRHVAPPPPTQSVPHCPPATCPRQLSHHACPFRIRNHHRHQNRPEELSPRQRQAPSVCPPLPSRLHNQCLENAKAHSQRLRLLLPATKHHEVLQCCH